jgi:hypothetical protein
VNRRRTSWSMALFKKGLVNTGRRRVTVALYLTAVFGLSACSSDNHGVGHNAAPGNELPSKLPEIDATRSVLVDAGPMGQGSQGAGDCERGAEGCPCYPNLTCDPKDRGDGVLIPMDCAENNCIPHVEPAEGSLRGRCLPNGVCNNFQGQTLRCIAGRCGLVDCPAGTMGCPCKAFGACITASETQCMDNFCVPDGCMRGAEDCVCGEGNSCAGDDLVCKVNICRRSQVVHVRVVALGARACDVLVELDEGKVIVRAAQDVRAENARHGRRLALSFMSTQNLDLPNRSLSFDLEPSTLARSERVSLISTTCYDRLGHVLNSAEVSLEF